MTKFLQVTAILLVLPLLGIWGRVVWITSAAVPQTVLRDDTRPLIPRESSSSSKESNVIEVRVPAGMRFVASRKGKKYYPVESSAGERIVPKNRVYFKTAQEAEAAGFRP